MSSFPSRKKIVKESDSLLTMEEKFQKIMNVVSSEEEKYCCKIKYLEEQSSKLAKDFEERSKAQKVLSLHQFEVYNALKIKYEDCEKEKTACMESNEKLKNQIDNLEGDLAKRFTDMVVLKKDCKKSIDDLKKEIGTLNAAHESQISILINTHKSELMKLNENLTESIITVTNEIEKNKDLYTEIDTIKKKNIDSIAKLSSSHKNEKIEMSRKETELKSKLKEILVLKNKKDKNFSELQKQAIKSKNDYATLASDLQECKEKNETIQLERDHLKIELAKFIPKLEFANTILKFNSHLSKKFYLNDSYLEVSDKSYSTVGLVDTIVDTFVCASSIEEVELSNVPSASLDKELETRFQEDCKTPVNNETESNNLIKETTKFLSNSKTVNTVTTETASMEVQSKEGNRIENSPAAVTKQEMEELKQSGIIYADEPLDDYDDWTETKGKKNKKSKR